MLDMNYTKPLPVITEESRPFWEGCRQGKLMLQRCEQMSAVPVLSALVLCGVWNEYASSGLR